MVLKAALILPPANDYQPSAIFAAISPAPPQNPEPTAARGKSLTAERAENGRRGRQGLPGFFYFSVLCRCTLGRPRFLPVRGNC